MTKQLGPITTHSLQQPPQRPEPPHDPPKEPVTPTATAAPTGVEYRVMVRHSPILRFKSLVVQATSPGAAWEAYQKELEAKLAAEGDPGKRILAAFRLWLSQQPAGKIPGEVSISTEDDHQLLRKRVREHRPRGPAEG